MVLLSNTEILLQIISDMCEFNKKLDILPLNTLYKKKSSLYKILFYDISNYSQLTSVEKQAIKSAFLAIKEFIIKSLDFKQFYEADEHYNMQLLIHMNKLISFSFDNEIEVGINGLSGASVNKFVKQDLLDMFASRRNIVWHIGVLQRTVCLADILGHAIKIMKYKPFKRFNAQLAFAWSWAVERSCIYKGFRIRTYIPWVYIAFQTIMQNKQECSDTTQECIYVYFNKIREYLTALSNTIRIENRMDISIRQKKAIQFLVRNKKITRSQYARLNNVSFMTAFRDLKDLVNKGIVQRIGKGIKTTYLLRILDK